MISLISVPNPFVFELIGLIGFGLYVINYTLLTFHRLNSYDALYFIINLTAASLVLTSLLVSFNLASAMIQAFWVLISAAAILVRLKQRLGRNRLRTLPNLPAGPVAPDAVNGHEKAPGPAGGFSRSEHTFSSVRHP